MHGKRKSSKKENRDREGGIANPQRPPPAKVRHGEGVERGTAALPSRESILLR